MYQMLKNIFFAFCAIFIVDGYGITRNDYPDADIVILDDSTRVEYAADGTYTVENDKKILALTEKGRRYLRSVTIGVSRRYGDAEILKVEIIGTNGVVRAVDFHQTLKETTDNSSVASNIYDPLDRKISCAVPGVQTGEIRRVVTRQRMLKPIMRDIFAYEKLFELKQPILRSSLEIIQPENRTVSNIKIRHSIEGTITKSDIRRLPDGRTVLSWVAENVPQAFPEPDMPEFDSVAQKLLVSTIDGWESVSRWYWELCQPRLEAQNSAMTNKVCELVNGMTDETDKIQSIFKFVSQEIRYMGLTLEDESPGYAPHDVRLTFDNRYGVCRDKAALLAAMLRIAGIKAFPVLINVGSKMDEDVPIPYFNHAIVAVEKAEAESGSEYLLMDPTNENTKDLLPAYLMDCSYLVAHPEGRPLAVVPVKPAEENVFDVVTKGSIEADGSALLAAKAVFKGVNDLYRGSFVKKTPKERRAAFEKCISSSYPGAELLSFDLLPADLRDTTKELSVEFTARVPDIVIRGKTRDELTVPFLFSNFGVADIILSSGTELENRRYPLVFASTALSRETLELRLGDSLGEALELPPDIVSGEKSGCVYERRVSVENSILKAIRKRSVGKTELSTEEYQDLKSDLKSIEIGLRRKPQFVARNAFQESNTRLLNEHKNIHLHNPFSWTVTNSWEREVLTYSGKKSLSEIVLNYNPVFGGVEIISATVSNKNGNVYSISSNEVNILDASWAAAAPRYPAAKKTVANLPSVETGSVIRVTSVSAVTNSPVPFCDLFSFDSFDEIIRKELSISGCEMKVLNTIPSNGSIVRSMFTTNCLNVVVTNPVPIFREVELPPQILWTRNVLVSAGDIDERRERLFTALESAREKESHKTRAKASELTKNLHAVEEKIKAIRDWLWKNIRVAGPGLFALPFDIAFFPPDRSLEDGYASIGDWMNLYFTMLESIGLDVEFVLSAQDYNYYPEIVRFRREVPQVDDFSDLLICAKTKKGGWFRGLFGGEEVVFILDYENEYTPIGVRDLKGASDIENDYMSIDLNDTGAARIAVSNSTWGIKVGQLRKRYSEMLPEMRSRHHTELVGMIAESAEAVSDLYTDVDGYPFVMAHSVYAANYAAKNDDTMTLVVPGLGGNFLPDGQEGRKCPFGISRRLRTAVFEREVIFPEGYTEIEYLPPQWEIKLPGYDDVMIRFSVDKKVVEDRLKIIFREEHFPIPSKMFSSDYQGYFRDWNRRTDSRLARTVVVRKRRNPNDWNR